MKTLENFAANMRRFRQARGLTQSELAEQLSVSLQTVFYYEKGERWPRADGMDLIARALRVQPWQLLATEGEGGEIPPQVVDLAGQLARACGLKVNGRS